MAGDEPVVAPDQLKVRRHSKTWKIAGIVVAVALVLMVIGNHHGHIEDIWLIVTALGIVGLIFADSVMKRAGLKR